jgi:hypothetical protein
VVAERQGRVGLAGYSCSVFVIRVRSTASPGVSTPSPFVMPFDDRTSLRVLKFDLQILKDNKKEGRSMLRPYGIK